MKSKSFEKVKYIIYTPKGVKTGGPEGMHQLAWALNKIGRQAVLLAWPNSQHNSPVVEYQKYNPKWCRISDINKKDIFIISESISFLPFWYFFFISKFRVYMWMHSVDFSLDNELNQYERKNYALNTEWNVNQNTVPQFKSIIKNIDIFGIYRKIICFVLFSLYCYKI
jgi:hypothetical protein